MTGRAVRVVVAAGILLAAVMASGAGLLVWQAALRRPPPVNGDLAFVTVEQARSPGLRAGFFSRAEPGLLVLTRRQDIADAQPYLRKTGLDGLRALDWDANFVIVAFRGYQTETVSNFVIERVVRQGAEVSIYASPGFVDEEGIPTSPYHIIAVRKVGRWQGVLTFRLFLDTGGEAALITKEVPESRVPQWP